MKLSFALMATALALASPAFAQVVTYSSPNSPDGVTSVTVNYNTQTITWYYSTGYTFTEAPTSSFRFRERAAQLEQTYSDDEPIDTDEQ